MTRLVAIATAAAALSGCYWTQPGFNAHRTGFNPHEHAITAANAATLEEVWSTSGIHGFELVRSQAGLLHAYGGELTTVDPEDGTVVWTASVDPDLDNGVPTILAIGETLHVPTYRRDASPYGCIERFDVLSGTDQGCLEFGMAAPATSVEQVDLDAVASGPWIVITSDYQLPGGGRAGWLSVVHTVQPDRSWSRPLEVGGGIVTSNPIVVGGSALVVTTASGAESVLQEWPLSCHEGCEPTNSTTLSTTSGYRIGASADGTQLAVVSSSGLEVLDLATRTTSWTADQGSFTGLLPSSRPTWTPQSLVVATDASGGGPTEVRSFPAEGCGAPTCAPTWSVQLDGFAGGQIAAAADIVVVSTAYMPLAVFPEVCVDPCEPVFSMEGFTFWGAPVISDGHIYVTREGDGPGWDMELVALRPSG